MDFKAVQTEKPLYGTVLSVMHQTNSGPLPAVRGQSGLLMTS